VTIEVIEDYLAMDAGQQATPWSYILRRKSSKAIYLAMDMQASKLELHV